MPFKSEAQRRYLWANEPEIARDWADTYGSKIQAAQGGRAGYYAGGQSIPSEYTVEDARKTAMQDKLGGITDVMKQADLYRQGDVGQMYMANGGIMRLPFRFGGGYQGSPGGPVERGTTAGDDKSYQTVQRPNPHLTGGTSLTSQVTGPRIRSSANEWIQNLNQQNAIRAAQEGTKFRPYQGGSRPQGGFWSGIGGGIKNFITGGLFGRGIGALKNKLGPAWDDWMASKHFRQFLNKRRARKFEGFWDEHAQDTGGDVPKESFKSKLPEEIISDNTSDDIDLTGYDFTDTRLPSSHPDYWKKQDIDYGVRNLRDNMNEWDEWNKGYWEKDTSDISNHPNYWPKQDLDYGYIEGYKDPNDPFHRKRESDYGLYSEWMDEDNPINYYYPLGGNERSGITTLPTDKDLEGYYS